MTALHEVPRDGHGVDAHPHEDAGEPSSILRKAFQVLHAFDSRERVLSLSQIARASGLPKSTVHRLIGRLIELGALEQHRSGYRIGIALFQISVNTPANSLRDRAMPALAALHRWTGLTVHFGVLRGYDVVYLEKLATNDSPSRVSAVGERLPANCSAIGKAMLAWEDQEQLSDSLPSPMPRLTTRSITSPEVLLHQLHEIRATGIASETCEAQDGLACIGVPIVVHDVAVAGVSLAFPEQTHINGKIESALRETAARITVDCRNRLSQGRGYMFPREI